MGKLANHNAMSVTEKKFWQVFSAKNIIKWYEYRMADSDTETQTEDSPEALEDRVSKIMDAFNNAKQDSVDSLLKELQATSQEEDTKEVDAAMEDEVARIMAQFAEAKQNSVDSLFAAANAQNCDPACNGNTDCSDQTESADGTEKIVVEKPLHPSTFDPDFGKLNADTDMNMISEIVNAQQNDIAALFAAQEAANNANDAVEEKAPEEIADAGCQEETPVPAEAPGEVAAATDSQPGGGLTEPLPEDMDPAMAAEVARIMAMFADAKQDSIDSLFQNQ